MFVEYNGNQSWVNYISKGSLKLQSSQFNYNYIIDCEEVEANVLSGIEVVVLMYSNKLSIV